MMKSKRVCVTDCEGPISKNDNAFELTSKFVPDGDKIFTVLSKYDDVLADVIKKPNYKAGDTLRLILPFFKAFGVTDKDMEDFSKENILLVPGASYTLKEINDIMPSYIVSTSYEHYIRALCGQIDFPFENTYSTRLKLDSFGITNHDKDELQKTAQKIASMRVISIPDSNQLSDFSHEDTENKNKLDQLFWKRIPNMSICRLLKEVKPVGGYEKANAVTEIAVEKLGVTMRDVMYVGDSITDVDVFRMVRRGGGLTVSFNGNNYAVREAEVGVTSLDTEITRVIAEVFADEGREGVLDYVKSYPRAEIITPENREDFSKHSSKFRKSVRGESIGKLG